MPQRHDRVLGVPTRELNPCLSVDAQGRQHVVVSADAGEGYLDAGPCRFPSLKEDEPMAMADDHVSKVYPRTNATNANRFRAAGSSPLRKPQAPANRELVEGKGVSVCILRVPPADLS